MRELFRVAEENAPSIVFIDEIDAVGTKRYDANSGGEREIQRTMLELLNQLDGFDAKSDIKVLCLLLWGHKLIFFAKVLMATNRIDSLDPALIRPGRIDRKIEVRDAHWLFCFSFSLPFCFFLQFPLPDVKTKRMIFGIHTKKMTLADDVKLEEFVMSKDELSGADIKAIATEAGLLGMFRLFRECWRLLTEFSAALRERRMKVCHKDFVEAKEKVLYRKKVKQRNKPLLNCFSRRFSSQDNVPQGMYL